MELFLLGMALVAALSGHNSNKKSHYKDDKRSKERMRQREEEAKKAKKRKRQREEERQKRMRKQREYYEKLGYYEHLYGQGHP
jgi:hypothetical protein